VEEAFQRHQKSVLMLGDNPPQDSELQGEPMIVDDWQHSDDEEMD
jgi:hypothetical protein